MKQQTKQTEIGEIPIDWEVSAFGNENYFQIIMGQSPPSESYNLANKGLGFLQGNAEFREMYPTIVKYTTKPLKVAESKDILISVRAPVGEINITKERVCIGRGLGAIRVLKGNYMFYYYYLNQIKQKIKNLGQGSTFQAITASELNKTSVPILKLEEQTAIAKILSTVDENLEILERERHATERLRRGVMVKLLTEGVGNKEFKFSDELKCKIPKHWQVVRYIDVADFINGFPFKPSDWKKKGLPIIRIQNLNGNKDYNHFDGKIDENYIINRGDLLFSWSATIDLFIWQKEKAVLNQHIFKVMPKDNIDKLYLYYAIKNFLSTISGKVHGSTMKHFKKEQLYKNYLPLPPLDEQRKIAEILNTIDEKLNLQKQRKGKLERIKKGLMDELLTGKKRVNIEKVLEVRKNG